MGAEGGERVAGNALGWLGSVGIGWGGVGTKQKLAVLCYGRKKGERGMGKVLCARGRVWVLDVGES